MEGTESQRSEVMAMQGGGQGWKVSGLFWLQHRVWKRKQVEIILKNNVESESSRRPDILD